MSNHKKKLKIIAIIVSSLTLLTILIAVVGYWVVVPKIAEDTLKQRLSRLENQANVSISTDSIQPDGLKGIKISNFRITDPNAPEGHQHIVEIQSLSVNIDKTKLLSGQKVISSLSARDASIHIYRDTDKQINLSQIVKALRTPKDKQDEPQETDTSDTPSFLRHFGGNWPDLNIHNVHVEFASDSTPFPLQSLDMDTVTLTPDGSQANFVTTISLKPSDDPNSPFTLPTSISTQGTLALPLEQSSLSFNVDRPFKITHIPHLPPSLRVGLSDIELSEGGKVSLTNLTLEQDKDGSYQPILDTPKAALQLEKFTTSLSQLKPLELILEQPTINLHILPDGTYDIYALLPKQKEKPQPKAPTDIPPKKTGTSALDKLTQKLKTADLAKLTQLVPHTINIQNATITIQDDRTLDLVRPSKTLKLQDTQLKLEHDPSKGSLSLHSSFKALGGEQGQEPHGDAELTLSTNYKTHLLKLSSTTHDLDLSWIAQLIPVSRLSTHFKGGTLNTQLKIEQNKANSPFSFEGDISIQRGHFTWDKLAEEPLTDWSLGYNFKGSYDPNAPIPPAKLLKTALDANVPEDPTQIGKSSRHITIPPPTKGALVFTKGQLRAQNFKAKFTPALYGLDSTKPLPARMDLAIKFPTTPIQDLFDAIPDALLGELSKAKIDGGIHMDFLLEVPLYDASNMVWQGEPETSNIEIVSLPDAVDVRRMVESFTHTIDDEDVLYTRKITIPAMTLTPSQWLAENAGLDEPQKVEDHWTRGGWLKYKDGILDTSNTRWKVATKPWLMREDSDIIRYWKPFKENQTSSMESEPYGPYTFVPLQFISKWLIRAILTTEDNSFFKHDGFNRLAFRQSVERDLAEGDYVRGASTISMQLIKNLYLTRKKVLARKIQEAILVWLTESVVQVPKARMLELYLNVIEFAPGVFGIHDGAIHYFGKRPDELTLAECAWLVTIVPGPKYYHSHFMRGEMSDRMFERIKRYMSIMHKRERVTEEELAEAILLKPQFHHPELKESALVPLPKEKPVFEDLFPELFGDTETSPQTPPINTPPLDPKPSPIKELKPLPRAQPDPAPPGLKLH